LGINADTLRNWVKQAGVNARKKSGTATVDRLRITN